MNLEARKIWIRNLSSHIGDSLLSTWYLCCILHNQGNDTDLAEFCEGKIMYEPLFTVSYTLLLLKKHYLSINNLSTITKNATAETLLSLILEIILLILLVIKKVLFLPPLSLKFYFLL